MSHGIEYGKASYWDDRYSNRDEESFDWYQRWAALKSFLTPYMTPQHRILMVGCGNALMSEDMVRDGFNNLVNIDISSVVIKKMQERNPHMTWITMDVTNMRTFEDASFDVVFDKGTLDAILCGDDSMNVAHRMLREIHRVLKPGGVFIDVTYGTPATRMHHLQRPGVFKWTIETRTIAKNEERGIPGDCHYVYICTKERS